MAKVSKVVKSNGDVIMDISQDNVNANNLLQGGTAHGSDGEAVQGAVIVAPTDVTEASDTTPYIYKASEHDAVYDELVGGSVAWNQLVANSGSSLSVTITSGHKYVMKKSGTLSVGASNGSAITGFTGGTDWITDLTLMFGTTIADYAYNLEQSTAGSGIAWLKSYGFFTKDYYAYNAGSLVSVNTSGKKLVGKNQCDKVKAGVYYTANGNYNAVIAGYSCTEKIKILPNTQYTVSVIKNSGSIGTDNGALFYDANGAYLGKDTGGYSHTDTYPFTFTTPSNATYCGIDINIQKSSIVGVQLELGSRATNYEPYTSLTYPIQSTDLRGLYKLNGTKLYTDNDIYSADGTVTRKYGIVDLGTLDWQLTSGVFTPTTNIGAKVQSIQGTLANILCPKYVTIQQIQISGKDKVIFGLNWGTGVGIIDSSYANATTFKTAMSGVYLIYELATPTTATAPPFTSPQIVYRSGTEEFIDTRNVPMPVGGSRKYVDIPDWMVNEYFDDVRAETSTLKTISKLQQENEVLRNALSQSTYFIPEGTTIIDSNTVTDKTKCFYYMPDTVHTIDENAFKGCANLINITLPDNVVTIEEAAFSNCKSLANINLSDTTLWIYDVAFFNCKSLTSIAIPSSVISISSSAFRGCTNLTSIVINKPQDSISGAPWEATNATVTWTG